MDNRTLSVIPVPAHVELGEGAFVLRSSCHIAASGGEPAMAVARQLVALLGKLTSLTLASPTPSGQGDILLQLASDLPPADSDSQAAEAYRLEITPARILLTARTPRGLASGMHTLVQLLTPAGANWRLPAARIEDAPRFRWRGLMLDCGRHLFSPDEICRLLDLMALYKLNTFHWHLTEDQGWRVPVSKYPRLTEVGAWRKQSPKMGDANTGDGQPYGGFYTHDDIRHIVAHAASRFIDVVPEIEMPGHSTAAIAAYPWLGNQDIPGWAPPAVSDHWGVHHMTLCPQERTFQFIEDVLDEVLPLFPSQYVHIGGDEAPKEQWQQSPLAQEVIRREGLKDEHELQAWFIRRVERMLTARGKRLIGWDEIQEGGLSPTATMMVWRKWDWATLALQRGNDVVMSPTSHAYFDYCEGAHPDSPEYQTIGQGTPWRRTLPLETVAAFEPIPPQTPVRQHRQVLGCEAQMWTEYIWSADKLDYMAFPRTCALAEAAWSSPEARSADPLLPRLQRHQALLDRLGVNYRHPDGTPARANAAMQRTPRPAK